MAAYLLDKMPDYESWGGTPLCADADPELFFPTTGANDGGLAAKAICAVCPVLEPCRTWALDNRERYGVWGGLSENERAYLTRRRRRRPRTVAA